MMPAPLAALRSLAVPAAGLALLIAFVRPAWGNSAVPAARLAFAAGTEPSAAGDIPDTQAFVRYTAPAGYSLLVPEGWSRTLRGDTSTFASHFNGLQVTVVPRSSPAQALRAVVPQAGAAKTSSARIGGAPVARLSFGSQSQPDPVTGKRIPLDDEAYVFVKGTRAAVLHVWAPHGADNADQWLKIAQSFRWR